MTPYCAAQEVGQPATEAPASIPDDGFVSLIMPATVNGTRHDAMQVRMAGLDVWVALADLQAAGLLQGVAPPQWLRTSEGVVYLVLRESAELLTWRLDAAQLALEVDLLPHAMTTHRLGLSQPQAPLPAGGQARMSSAYLNYSLNDAGGQRPTLFAEAVASVRGHVFQMLAQHDGKGTRRGAASFTFNDEPGRRQAIFGDSTSAPGGLLPGVPLGGITWRSSFSYEPWALTSPTLDLRGYAATPSTVDVLVNGARVAQRQIPAGPFELRDILPAGGGTQVSAVVRDAFGRETRFAGDGFYASPLLLRQGLSAWSISLGRLREEQAEAGPRYGQAVISAQASHGWSRALTAGGSVQLTGLRQAAGVHAVATGNWGEAGAQFAASRTSGGAPASGAAGTLSWRHTDEALGVGLSVSQQSRGFETAGSLAARPLSAVELSAGRRQFGVDWGARLALSRDALDARSRTLSVTASRRIGSRLSAVAGANVGRGASSAASVWLLLTWSFDTSHTVSAGITREFARDAGPSASFVEAVSSPQEALSTGWRLSTAQPSGGPGRQSAQVRRDTAFGDYEFSASRQDGASASTSWRASGALLWADGVVAASPPVRDAFAVVRVAGLANVPVRVEGRVAGVTDAAGQLVLPHVASYARQRVSIDANELPEGHEIGETEKRMSPPQRGGEVLTFEPRVYHAVTGRLLATDGHPLPGATIFLPDGRSAITATGGDFAIEGQLPAGADARVEFAVPGGMPLPVAAPRRGCGVRLPPPESPGTVQRLGDVQCAP